MKFYPHTILRPLMLWRPDGPPQPGWNGIWIMARRRSSPARGSRSNVPPKSRGPRPGAKPRLGPPNGPRRDQAGPRQVAKPLPRLFKGGDGPEPEKQERLQKVLAHAGLGSRRGCEELILQGRVSINGEIIRQLGTRVDRSTARITVDGETIRLETNVYYAVNKPKGYVSTNVDPSGRPRVVDLLPEIPERVFTVGRLDEDSTGLMILTNDGDLANRLAHPRYGVEKLYRALVAGVPTPEMVAKLTEGVWLSDGKVRAKRARIAGRQGLATSLELVLAEGKKREIRRMLSKLGHKVMALNRIAVGPISLKGLAVGECRPLTRHEIELLQKAAAGASVPPPRFSDGGGSSRPHGESRRPRKPENNRSARNHDNSAPRHVHDNEDGPPRRPSHHTRIENAPQGGSRRPGNSPPARPGSSSPGRNSPGAPKGRSGPPQLPAKRIDQSNVPAKLRRKGPATALPPEPLKIKRRIIGLELDSPSRPKPVAAGGRTRKRPTVRKRRPPGPTLGKKRDPSTPTDTSDGDDA
jgi:23S rRNA pseudouridine2605 synthase